MLPYDAFAPAQMYPRYGRAGSDIGPELFYRQQTALSALERWFPIERRWIKSLYRTWDERARKGPPPILPISATSLPPEARPVEPARLDALSPAERSTLARYHYAPQNGAPAMQDCPPVRPLIGPKPKPAPPMPKHPTPWVAAEHTGEIHDANGRCIADIYGEYATELAETIVTLVNAAAEIAAKPADPAVPSGQELVLVDCDRDIWWQTAPGRWTCQDTRRLAENHAREFPGGSTANRTREQAAERYGPLREEFRPIALAS